MSFFVECKICNKKFEGLTVNQTNYQLDVHKKSWAHRRMELKKNGKN